jgi:hypothetical protein
VRQGAGAPWRANRFWISRAAMVPVAIAVAMQGWTGLATSPTANTPQHEVSMLPSTAM